MADAVAGLTGLTWEEYLALPFETRNCDLVDGTVIVNAPSAANEMAVNNLLMAWTLWARAAPHRGEASTQQPVKVNDRRGYQPDLAWYPAERCAPPGGPPSFSGLPGIVVEVFSPSTRRLDVVRKRNDYDRLGVGELWFVDPEDHTVMVLRRSRPDGPYDVQLDLDGTGELASALLPSFTIGVAALFVR